MHARRCLFTIVQLVFNFFKQVIDVFNQSVHFLRVLCDLIFKKMCHSAVLVKLDSRVEQLDFDRKLQLGFLKHLDLPNHRRPFLVPDASQLFFNLASEVISADGLQRARVCYL
jgi:hypothetical protein